EEPPHAYGVGDLRVAFIHEGETRVIDPLEGCYAVGQPLRSRAVQCGVAPARPISPRFDAAQLRVIHEVDVQSIRITDLGEFVTRAVKVVRGVTIRRDGGH